MKQTTIAAALLVRATGFAPASDPSSSTTRLPLLTGQTRFVAGPPQRPRQDPARRAGLAPVAARLRDASAVLQPLLEEAGFQIVTARHELDCGKVAALS